jgi:glycosyltransferase involved in cell wall biosynthesis
MQLSVIIPTFNRKTVLRHTILALINQGIDDYEVIVCDDGSDDGTREMIMELTDLPFSIVYKFQEKNGFRAAAARNMGIETAKGTKIAFIDHDVLLSPNVLKIFNSITPGYFITGIKRLVPLDTYEKTFTDQVVKEGFTSITDQFGTIPATLSSFGVITREDLNKVEKFDEEFVGYGLEDTEMIDRLHDIKIGSGVERSCISYHIEHDYEPRRVSRQIQDIYHHKRNNSKHNGKIVI